MENKDEVLEIHERNTGVLEMKGILNVTNRQELGKAYTPGVAKIAKLIEKNEDDKNKYTISGKLVALISDGSAVLGLGNVGPSAGLPIIEGKALLYKELAGVDAVPIAIDQVEIDEIVKNIQNISKSFAGIHLEDIEAPRVFEIEEKLANKLDIPVYHDDQTGTAIVVLAGLINAAKVVNKELKNLKVVVNGVGASGVATAKLLLAAGIKNITLVDIDGVVHENDTNYNSYQRNLAKQVTQVSGDTLDEIIDQQDVFVGLSDANVLSANQVSRMANDAIVFALANPTPEINPNVAKEGGAKVTATGSSEWENQVNNILVFPGLFKGLIKYGVKKVESDLQIEIAKTLASLIDNPTPEAVVPGVFQEGVVEAVTEAIKKYSENK